MNSTELQFIWVPAELEVNQCWQGKHVQLKFVFQVSSRVVMNVFQAGEKLKYENHLNYLVSCPQM